MTPAAKALTRSESALVPLPCMVSSPEPPPRCCHRLAAKMGGSTPSSEQPRMTNATPTRALRPESIAKWAAGGRRGTDGAGAREWRNVHWPCEVRKSKMHILKASAPSC